MAVETIWTAIPTGRTRDGKLLLTAFVAPRLTHAGAAVTLADFQPMATWPPADLVVEVEVGPVFYPSSAVRVVSAPDPDVWAAVMAPTLPVRSFVPVDTSQTVVHTYSLSKIAAFLQEQWAKVGVDSPEQPEEITTLLASGFGQIRYDDRVGADRWRAAQLQLQRRLATQRVVDTRAPSSTTFDFVCLADFFAALDGDDPDVVAAYAQPVDPPDLDFHAVVQHLAQHPTLLRLLGLALDLEIDTTRRPPPTTRQTEVSLRPVARALVGTTVRCPTTVAQITSTTFTALPRTGTTHLTPGWLRLEDTSVFEPMSVDVDGGGLKALAFASNLGRTTTHPTDDTPTTAGLPTLRQDGFSVAWKGKGQALHDTLAGGPDWEAALGADSLTLHLDDLVRGVRVDVWDEASSTWHSLMRRTGGYQLLGGSQTIAVDDEGCLGTSATRKPLSADLYVSEEVFWWDGWSLVAPRPGQVLVPDSDPAQPLAPRPPNAPGPDVDVRVRFDVGPGTLPRLRHGVRYRFRARLVDLAGGSLPTTSDEDAHATAPVRFGRFEPPQSPPVLLRRPKGPGESVETVVLRADGEGSPPAPPTAERHLVPPKVGELTVERQGVIDGPDPDGSLARYQQLAARDAATLLEHPDIDAGNGDRDRWYDVDQVHVTWAPDPMVRQLFLRMLDGPHAGTRIRLPVGELVDWPDLRAHRLVLESGSGAPQAVGGVLRVRIPPAQIWHARVSMAISTDELDSFALWPWLLDALPPGPAGAQRKDELLASIAAGQHHQLEPGTVLTLVHAVRRPLRRPQWRTTPTVARVLDATFATVGRELFLDRASTGKADVLASWREPVDLGPGTGPPAALGDPGATVVDRQTAFSLDVPTGTGLPPDKRTFSARHELGDTKHRTITYRARLTTRFPEFFTTTAALTWGAAGTAAVLDTGSPAVGVVPGSVKLTVEGPSGPLHPAEGRQFVVDAATGTITFKKTRTQTPPVGSQVSAVYLVPPITRDMREGPPDAAELGPVALEVPCSARPAAPMVRQVLPTFGWAAGPVRSGGQVVGVSSSRVGGGLRLYLERPWWSSGDGELLAVVLWPPGEAADPPDPEGPVARDDGTIDPAGDLDERRPFVSQWGQDPVYASLPLPSRFPRVAHFPDAVATATGVSLGELGSSSALPVTVAGHPVVYDERRDLWFCDLAVTTGSAYAPLVRLALARWQPHSLPAAALSRVVLADVATLAPGRVATVLYSQRSDRVLDVSLSGPSYAATAAPGVGPGAATVQVEQRRPGVPGELGWEPVGAPVALRGSLSGGSGSWSGRLTLPGPRTPGAFRLVVEQFETLLRERPTTLRDGTFPPLVAQRLVHTDVVPL